MQERGRTCNVLILAMVKVKSLMCTINSISNQVVGGVKVNVVTKKLCWGLITWKINVSQEFD